MSVLMVFDKLSLLKFHLIVLWLASDVTFFFPPFLPAQAVHVVCIKPWKEVSKFAGTCTVSQDSPHLRIGVGHAR